MRGWLEANMYGKEKITMELLEALQDIVAASSAYMKYHAEKFYSATEQPTGLWPAIERANASIAKIKGGHHEILRH